MAVTLPLSVTVAIDRSSLAHDMVASISSGVSVTVRLTDTPAFRGSEEGVTSTLLSVFFRTVTAMFRLIEPKDAVIDASPCLMALTEPLSLTVATAGLVDSQTIALMSYSNGVGTTVIFEVAPSSSVSAVGMKVSSFRASSSASSPQPQSIVAARYADRNILVFIMSVNKEA